MSEADEKTRRAERQRRILSLPLSLPDTASGLFDELYRALLFAWKQGRLLSQQSEIHDLLRRKRPSDAGVVTSDQLEKAGVDQKRAHLIVGGQKDERRRSDEKLFRRYDDALFNFYIVVRETRNQPLELLVYHFELRLPPDKTPAFVRFDLQMPGTKAEEHGMRCHIHPGNEGLIVPSPLLAPIEMLELFLYEASIERERG